MWYLTGLTWKKNFNGPSDLEDDGKERYIIGGSVVGLPVISYGRSANYAWGATAVNPDNSDLFVEKVEGDKYFFDG